MSAKTFEEIGLPTARHHLFLCVGPDCCTTAQGLTTWEHLKASLKEHRIPAMRTKAACLQRCVDGPWLVVYPDGVWYAQVTPERFDRIRREHLQGGVPVAEWVRAVQPLDKLQPSPRLRPTGGAGPLTKDHSPAT